MMNKIGVQTKNIITDECPADGFKLLKKTGFSCVDFSLNGYLLNTDLYQKRKNAFFDQTDGELEQFFTPHKQAATEMGIEVNQMHMPYPIYVPGGPKSLNEYLWRVVAPKCMNLCSFFGCRCIVVHGFKLVRYLGSEEAEWGGDGAVFRVSGSYGARNGYNIMYRESIRQCWRTFGRGARLQRGEGRRAD